MNEQSKNGGETNPKKAVKDHPVDQVLREAFEPILSEPLPPEIDRLLDDLIKSKKKKE